MKMGGKSVVPPALAPGRAKARLPRWAERRAGSPPAPGDRVSMPWRVAVVPVGAPPAEVDRQGGSRGRPRTFADASAVRLPERDQRPDQGFVPPVVLGDVRQGHAVVVVLISMSVGVGVPRSTQVTWNGPSIHSTAAHPLQSTGGARARRPAWRRTPGW
jgi:hypothetical protein